MGAVVAAGRLEFHDAASLFPMHGREQFAELRHSIEKHGWDNSHPVVLCDGKILDGRNRYLAALELGVEPTYVSFVGNPFAKVWLENGSRRDLEASQKAIICELADRKSEEWQLAQERRREEANRRRHRAAKAQPRDADGTFGTQNKEKSAGPGSRDPGPEDGRARVTLAAQAGVSQATAKRALALVNSHPELAKEVADGKLSLGKALREAREKAELSRRAEALKKLPGLDQRYRLIRAAVADVGAEIEPESVDVIITDPPYGREFIGAYGELGALAARALKPGGSCVVMCGQSYLPEVLAMLNAHLSYYWTCAYLTPGPKPQLWQRKVNTGWKPILWFVKGTYVGGWVGDVMRSEKREKAHHDWGQSESGLAELVERFSGVGSLVFDPFVGGGSTAVVALTMDRRFVGSDVDHEAIEKTTARIRGEVEVRGAG